jgi:glycosyltransferase involved in cell wall biosynthesis
MTESGPPEAVMDAASQRADARAARDWSTADRLRAEIEAAGWRVVDAGTAYRLERASPPDVDVGGEIRYGRSDAVPSRLEEPATGLATVVVVASPDRDETQRVLTALRATVPDGVDIVLVADGLSNAALAGLVDPAGASADAIAGDGARPPLELVRTSEPLGHAAALNIGIRRAGAPIVVVLDPSVVPTGDVVTPLVRALDDPAVAIAGPFGLVSDDLRHFDEPTAPAPGAPAAIQGYLMAFRRADAIERGPFDEAFRFYRNLDIWWSLVLRDEGEGNVSRRAAVVPGLPLERSEPRAWVTTAPAVRDRLSKRNFYRILDRFRTRDDLASS